MEAFAYFNELLTDVKTELRLEPRPFTATMIAIEMPAAMSPYSIAVAPDSLYQNFKTRFFILLLCLPRNAGRARLFQFRTLPANNSNLR
jgi:hypothetical protein